MTLLRRTGTNLLYKLVVFPVILYGFTIWVPPLLTFSSIWQVASLSILFIAIGLVADETVLPRFGNLAATAQGFLFMAAAIWVSQFIFPGSRVTFAGTLLLSLLLGLAELIIHRWLLRHREQFSDRPPSR